MKEPEAELLKALKNLLKSLEASLNIKEKLEDHQAFEIVIELAREFKHLTLDEFIYCFRKAKLGHYGKDYHRIDILTISLWLRDYMFSSERQGMQKAIENEKKWKDFGKDATDPTPEYLDAEKKIREAAQKLTVSKTISINGFAQSDYHNQLKENILNYSDDELQSLHEDALKQNDQKVIEIIDAEICSRG